MSIILVLIPLSILIAICFLGAFIWAVRSGQFEDTCTPSMRVLMDEATTRTTMPPITRREATNPTSHADGKINQSADNDNFGQGGRHP